MHEPKVMIQLSREFEPQAALGTRERTLRRPVLERGADDRPGLGDIAKVERVRNAQENGPLVHELSRRSVSALMYRLRFCARGFRSPLSQK